MGDWFVVRMEFGTAVMLSLIGLWIVGSIAYFLFCVIVSTLKDWGKAIAHLFKGGV